MTLVWIVTATIATGVLSVLAAAPIAFATAQRWIPYLVSYAVGTLLGVAFLELLPTAAVAFPLRHICATVLVGIFAFFLLEKFALWHQALPGPEGHVPWHGVQPAGPMILVGDALHNFTDGLLLAAAFLTDLQLGLVATGAVVAHEIPRELGDFAVLLDSGFSWRRALFWNVVFSFTAIGGGVLGYFAFSAARPAIPYVIALAAASFIYVAVADLVPGLHRHATVRASVGQSLAMACGVTGSALAAYYLG